jgi:hypothetical protein
MTIVEQIAQIVNSPQNVDVRLRQISELMRSGLVEDPQAPFEDCIECEGTGDAAAYRHGSRVGVVDHGCGECGGSGKVRANHANAPPEAELAAHREWPDQRVWEVGRNASGEIDLCEWTERDLLEAIAEEDVRPLALHRFDKLGRLVEWDYGPALDEWRQDRKDQAAHDAGTRNMGRP